MRKLLTVVGATLLMAACGGIEAEETSAELGQTEQGLSTAAATCPTGYSQFSYWDCSQVCGNRWGNYLVTYCTNGTDTFLLSTGSVRCGACY